MIGLESFTYYYIFKGKYKADPSSLQLPMVGHQPNYSIAELVVLKIIDAV